MHGQAGRRRLASASASPKWSPWPWVTSSRSQRPRRRRRRGLIGLPSHGSNRIDLAARGPDLDAGVAEPRERGVRPIAIVLRTVAGRRHRRYRGVAPAAGRARRYTPRRARRADRPQPRLHQLDAAARPSRVGLVRAGRARAPADATRRRATSASRRCCAAAFGVLAYLSDGALPATAAAGSPVTVDPACDAPAPGRARLLAVGRARHGAARRPAAGGPAPLALAGAGAGLAALALRRASPGAAGRVGRRRRSRSSSLALAAATGGVFAAMILGHWYLVTPEAARGPLVLAPAPRSCSASSRSRSSCSWSGWGSGARARLERRAVRGR